MKGRKLENPSTVGSWAVVCFGEKRSFELSTLERFIRHFVKIAEATGTLYF